MKSGGRKSKPHHHHFFLLFVPLVKTINKRYLLVHNNNVIEKENWLTRNRHMWKRTKRKKCVNLRWSVGHVHWKKCSQQPRRGYSIGPTDFDGTEEFWCCSMIVSYTKFFFSKKNNFYCLFIFSVDSSFPSDQRNKLIQELNLAFFCLHYFPLSLLSSSVLDEQILLRMMSTHNDKGNFIIISLILIMSFTDRLMESATYMYNIFFINQTKYHYYR
jgi:hypothetical protein